MKASARGVVGRHVVAVLVGVLVVACSTTTTSSTSTPVTSAAAPIARAAFTVAGATDPPTRVSPPPGHPLGTVDRDAGVAVRLRDGSVLWLFGDTSARDDAGHLAYFQIGTASWAPASDPTGTRDAVDPATGEPVRFATPTAGFPSCPAADQKQGMWPASAAVEAVGARDRVVVWLENICLGSDGSLVDEGMSVAEWFYDPANPPNDRPIQATMLNQRLFPSLSYGGAVVPVAGGDHLVDVYWCGDAPGGSAGPRRSCRVGQTSLDTAADPSSYREWNGSTFGAAVGEGRPLVMPASGTRPYPPGGFSVALDPVVKEYVMAYSPWPGATDEVDVRTAARPQGPWTAPIHVTLPGCSDRFGERLFGCYAAAVQPSFSTGHAMGIGYYDTMISSFPIRGSYMITTVPVRPRH